ncbi:MAG TPA: sigma-70 family RNA polymerase sigma factor [Puia sp.]|nr:sigma-70 family RNA polymerase sigma factor [Puia sp.]
MKQEYLDPLLIGKIRDGDNQAFKVIMDHLHERLAALAFQLLSHRENVEDAIAQGFLKLFEKREEMESISHVEGFLHETIKNLCLDMVRKDQRRKKLWELRPAWVARSEQTTQENEADYKVLKAELAYCIQSALDKMPEQWRAAYQLYIVDKMTAKEVGEQLGVSDQTVRKYAQLAAGEIYAAAISKGLHILLILLLLRRMF